MQNIDLLKAPQRAAAEETWLPLARPIVARLDRTWREEDRVLAGMAESSLRLFGAERLGFVERRKHWLTRRSQLRLSLRALGSNKLSAEIQRVRA